MQFIRDAVADEDLRECSFQPKTNERYVSMDGLTQEIQYRDQAERFADTPFKRLHVSARSSKFKNRRDKDSEQIDYE